MVVYTEMNLIAFSDPRNCVNMQPYLGLRFDPGTDMKNYTHISNPSFLEFISEAHISLFDTDTQTFP